VVGFRNRLYGLALGLQFGDVKAFKAADSRSGGWGATVIAGLVAYAVYRYVARSR
jgi:hypothetical protein